MKSMKMMFAAVLVFGMGLGATGGADARIARCHLDPQCMADCVPVGDQTHSAGNCLRMCCIVE